MSYTKIPTIDKRPLSDAEIELVRKHRADQDAKHLQHKAEEHLLQTALEFHDWLYRNGAGATYSTFIDDFGYTAYGNREIVYRKVMQMIDLVRKSG